MWTLGCVEFHDQVNPVLLRQEIGRRLRNAREAAGLTVLEAEARLDVSAATISRVETGTSTISAHTVQSMMRLYGLDDDELPDLARRARRPGWWKQYGLSDRQFVALETGAGRLSTFDSDLVNGLLQTADYARAMFNAAMKSRSKPWIDTQLEVRMIRQERLVDEDFPLHLDAVISEFALHRPVGGAEVMRAQLRHLALVTELPTVTLRVLPVSVVSGEAMYGAFTILDFPSAQPSMVYLEHALGQDRTEKAEPVAKARLRFSHLRSLALDPEESLVLIEQVADDL